MGPHTPSRILQILGGWSDLKQVEIYCQPFEGSMRAAMEQGAIAPRKSVGKMSGGLQAPNGKLRKLMKSNKNAPVAQLDRASVS